MQPADAWHAQLAEERSAIVRQLETQYEGCDDHTVGRAVLTP